MNATFVVLVIVIALVISYLVHCRRLVRSDDPSIRLSDLSRRLRDDIRDRVASGRNLDWVYYSDEAQRKQEDLREHLRNYGTISLATGVGGTMGALALHLLAADASQGDALEGLLREMGWALVAAGTGVVGNLAILWGLLPWANRRFNPALDKFLEELREEEAEGLGQVHPMSQTTAEIIGDRLGEELRRAIARVPEMFEQLGHTANKLGDDVATLTSATTALVESTPSLNRMPKDLDAVLGKAIKDLSGEADALRNDMRTWNSERHRAAEEWHANLQGAIETASSKHDEVANKLSDTASAVAASVNDAATRLGETTQAVRQSVGDLPHLVASAVEGSGELFGRKLSEAVEPHVTDFREGVVDGLGKTIEWQNAVSEHLTETRQRHDRAMHDLASRTAVVAETVQGLPGAVADGVEKVSDKLGQTFGYEARQHVADLSRTLREDAEKLQRSLQKHESHLLNTTVQELRDVSEQLINKTVRDLEGITGKLSAVLDGFPEHVAAVNTGLGDAEGELRSIVARIEEISSALRSTHEDTRELLAGLGSSTENLQHVIRTHAQAIGELAEALRLTQRKSWWRRLSGLFGRRRDEEPGVAQAQGVE